jgi:hypothetical protein
MTRFFSRAFASRLNTRTKPTTRRMALQLESLVQRILPSSNNLVTGDTLFINADPNGCHVEVTRNTQRNTVEVQDYSNQFRTQSFSADPIKHIQFTGGPGNDQFHNNTDIPAVAVAGTGTATSCGGLSHDHLIAGNGNDILISGPGGAWIDPGSGLQTLQDGNSAPLHVGLKKGPLTPADLGATGTW